MTWRTHRIIVEVPVNDKEVGETDVRYAVEHLIGGSKLHQEIARMRPVMTGRVQVKMWSKAKRWLKEEL